MKAAPRYSRRDAKFSGRDRWPTPLAAAFTLLELLVLMAVAAILLALALPIYDRPGPNLAVRCLNNTKQLTLGWMIFATDHEDSLIANEPYVGGLARSDNWVCGIMDWSANEQNTNLTCLLTNRLGDYIKSVQVYHCPSDRSESAAGKRIRSYTMNVFMNGGTHRVGLEGWQQYRKLPEIASPVNLFVVVDEHPNSIDDGCFFNDPNRTSRWESLPAGYHAGAAGFSFADGHSEIHKWQDSSTRQPVVVGGPKPNVIVQLPQDAIDLNWTLDRTTVRQKDAATQP